MNQTKLLVLIWYMDYWIEISLIYLPVQRWTFDCLIAFRNTSPRHPPVSYKGWCTYVPDNLASSSRPNEVCVSVNHAILVQIIHCDRTGCQFDLCEQISVKLWTKIQLSLRKMHLKMHPIYVSIKKRNKSKHLAPFNNTDYLWSQHWQVIKYIWWNYISITKHHRLHLWSLEMDAR